MEENVFPKGIFLQPKRENAPDFVLGSLNFKVDEALQWLKENEKEDGYVNCDILKSKEGKNYLKLNTWKPKEQAEF